MAKRRGLDARYARSAYLMLLPAIAFFAVFTYLPIGNLLTTSIHSGPQADELTGLGNYSRAFSDPAVRHAFGITVGFAVVTTVGALVLGLALALLLNRPLRGRVAFRALLLVPYLTSVAIVGLQAFGQAYIITDGGPAGATDLYVFHVFNVAFEARDFGYSSALSFLLVVVILAATVVQLRYGLRGEVRY